MEVKEEIQLWKAQFLDNIGEVVVIYDREYKHLYANEATVRESKLSAEEMIGKSNRDLGVPSDIKQVEARENKIDEVFATGEATEYVTFHIFSQGNKEYYLTKFIPEKQKDEVVYVYAITRNITAQIDYQRRIKKNNKKLQIEKKQVDEVNRTLENFVHVIAHDLKGPLNNIQQLINIYDKEDSEERRKKYFELIKSSFARFENTILSLMEIIMAKNEGETPIRKLLFEDVFNMIMSDLENGLEVGKWTIKIEFEEAEINYIESYLVSILKNLLSNSIKYRDKERPLLLEVKTKKQGIYTLLTVKDNGIGIDLKLNGDKLFLPFKRLTTQGEGKGIGLSIIKSMVEKNGGRIEVDSKPNEGTSFRIFLKEY